MQNRKYDREKFVKEIKDSLIENEFVNLKGCEYISYAVMNDHVSEPIYIIRYKNGYSEDEIEMCADEFNEIVDTPFKMLVFTLLGLCYELSPEFRSMRVFCDWHKNMDYHKECINRERSYNKQRERKLEESKKKSCWNIF